MKSLLYFMLLMQPVLAFGKVTVAVVEQKYLSALSKSFNNDTITFPRSQLYWSLCLGENSILNKDELGKRIAALETDDAARVAFYKRLNYYRAYKANPKNKKEDYGDVFLPVEKNPKYPPEKVFNITVLSYDKPIIQQNDWIDYCDYVTSFGQDTTLAARWNEYAAYDGSGSVDGSNKKVFAFVESNPVFPGGEKQLMGFLAHQLEYPEAEREKDIEGKVLLRFVVDTDGHVSSGTVIRSVNEGFDKEAILVLKLLPPFIAGKQGGVAVPVYFNLPMVFRLQ